MKKMGFVILTISYPFILYFCIRHLSVSSGAIALLLLVVARQFLPVDVHNKMMINVVSALGMILVMLSLVLNRFQPLQWYPVIVNFALLGVFAYTLKNPPSMIERFARITNPELPYDGVLYTRKVTQIWCLFFVINGTFSMITIFYGSPKIWALYNGFIAYILMACLLVGEWLYRRCFLSQFLQHTKIANEESSEL